MEGLKSLPARPESLAQIVYSAIRQAIVDKSLEPGSEVSEVGLARRLNVSKTPVREAVLRLRERQLIEQDENRVLRIVSPSAERINDAYEIRAALEAQAAALAAERIDGDELDELRQLAELTVETCEHNNTFDFRRHDVTLHQRIAQASKNAPLTEMTINAIEVTDVLRTRDVPATAASRRCAHEHVDLVNALAAKDSERARAIAMRHVSAVHKRLLQVYLQSTQEIS